MHKVPNPSVVRDCNLRMWVPFASNVGCPFRDVEQPLIVITLTGRSWPLAAPNDVSRNNAANHPPRITISPNSATLKPATAPSGGAQWRFSRDCGAMSWKMR